MKIPRQLVWWLSFFIATFGLSKVFYATRLITSETALLEGWSNLLLWGSILALSLMILGYDAYTKAKAEGKLARTVWLFEKIDQFCQQEKMR
jgi:hypothetical protein